MRYMRYAKELRKPLLFGTLCLLLCLAVAALRGWRMAKKTPEEIASLRANLLKYCGLDTYAMVKVLAKLREQVVDEMREGLEVYKEER